jgi:hypothetical protein
MGIIKNGRGTFGLSVSTSKRIGYFLMGTGLIFALLYQMLYEILLNDLLDAGSIRTIGVILFATGVFFYATSS